MSNLPQEVSKAPPAHQPSGSSERKTEPGLIAASGALMGAGFGFGIPGAIAGGILGFAVGKWAEKEQKEREKID